MFELATQPHSSVTDLQIAAGAAYNKLLGLAPETVLRIVR
jgi:hypothetical protein